MSKIEKIKEITFARGALLARHERSMRFLAGAPSGVASKEVLLSPETESRAAFQSSALRALDLLRKGIQ